jgi:phage N-6-adenine-methyltransferase
MSHWEGAIGDSDDWYTPKYIFDALEATFALDVAAPEEGPKHVPCDRWYWKDGLTLPWEGFVWMNPPYGGRNGLVPWLDKFADHGNGIALVPDRTSAPWWQDLADWAEEVFFVKGKIKFIRPDGSEGKQPSNGTTLVGLGQYASIAFEAAEFNDLGKRFVRRFA